MIGGSKRGDVASLLVDDPYETSGASNRAAKSIPSAAGTRVRGKDETYNRPGPPYHVPPPPPDKEDSVSSPPNNVMATFPSSKDIPGHSEFFSKKEVTTVKSILEPTVGTTPRLDNPNRARESAVTTPSPPVEYSKSSFVTRSPTVFTVKPIPSTTTTPGKSVTSWQIIKINHRDDDSSAVYNNGFEDFKKVNSSRNRINPTTTTTAKPPLYATAKWVEVTKKFHTVKEIKVSTPVTTTTSTTTAATNNYRDPIGSDYPAIGADFYYRIPPSSPRPLDVINDRLDIAPEETPVQLYQFSSSPVFNKFKAGFIFNVHLVHQNQGFIQQ